MKKRSMSGKQLPVKYPSVRAADSGDYTYNEPPVSVRADRVPSLRFKLRDTDSKADLRLRIELLLMTRDSGSEDAWQRVGEEGRSLMVELLDDEVIRSQDAVFHRLICALGNLAVKQSVAPLSVILLDKATTSLTKAYAANALGRTGEATAIDALVTSMTAKGVDDMVLRQIAIAFSRIDRETVIPHLMKLQRDPSISVSEVATAALRRWEQRLGERFDAKGPKGAKASKKKIDTGRTVRSRNTGTPLPER
jgi:HEAT repeats